MLAFSAQEESASSRNNWVSQLEPMGIKLSTEVTPQCQCFLRSKGTMTPSALLAVAMGLPIVEIDYINALFACKDSLESNNYEDTIPDPLLFMSDSDLVPDKRRSTLYTGLTFAFWDRDQYNQVLPVIEACGGRAVVQDSSSLTVKSIAEFLQREAVEASENLVSADKAISSGAIIPVKLLIETPDIVATELLVKVNTATKALGVCLMDQAMISTSIKNVTTKHMFRLRPLGAMPELLNVPSTPPARSDVKKTARQGSGKITDFFTATPAPVSRSNSGSSSGASTGISHVTGTSQIPHLTKASQVRPKIENPFFQTVPHSGLANLPHIKPNGLKNTLPISIKDEPKRTTPSTDSQDIFTFFTQGASALPAPKTTSKPETQIPEEDQETVLAITGSIVQGSQKRTLETDLNPLEEATRTAAEFKKRKLAHELARAEQLAAAQEEVEMIEDEMPDEMNLEDMPGASAEQQEQAKITFKEALRTVKKEQVDAYVYNQLGGTDQQGLSENEILGLRNLAIVESGLELRSSENMALREGNSGHWAGRPNFKRFKKVLRDVEGTNKGMGIQASHTTAQIMLIEVNPQQMRIQSDVDWLKNDPKGKPNRQSTENPVSEEPDAEIANNEESLFVGGGMSSSDEDEENEIEMTSFRRSRSTSAKPKSASSSVTGGSPSVSSATAGSTSKPTQKRGFAVVEADSDEEEENDGLGFKFSK